MNSQNDLKVKEALITLNCARSTLYKLINENKLSVYKVGRATRIRRDSIERLRRGDQS